MTPEVAAEDTLPDSISTIRKTSPMSFVLSGHFQAAAAVMAHFHPQRDRLHLETLGPSATTGTLELAALGLHVRLL